MTKDEVEQKRLHLVGAMAVGLVDPKKDQEYTLASFPLRIKSSRADA
jgi:hypothetical protein